VDPGKLDAPQFDRHAPDYRRKLWVRLSAPGGSTRLVILWRRIFVVLFLLAVAGWLAAAGAVYAFIRVRHDFAEASYVNLAWPPRWPQHRQALGRHYITRGQAALAAGEFIDAANFYAAGVSRVPADAAARRQLAIIYLRFGQTQASVELLATGLSGAREDIDYLKLTFGLLDELQEDLRILELTRQCLPAQPDGILAHQFMALQAATARYHRGDYDHAEQIIADWKLDNSLEGQLLLARCDWERGYPELALQRLQDQRTRFPGRDELVLQLIRFYRELGRNELALNEALVRHVADPASPGPRIDLLYAWSRTRDQVRLNRELESYLHDFATDPTALLLLGWFAADDGNAALARRVRDLAAARGHPLAPYELVLVQSLANEGDYPAALAAAEAALKGAPADQTRFTGPLAGLRALACFGAGDAANGEIYLRAFVLRPLARATDSLLLARRLNEIGAKPQARLVLSTALQAGPLNQAVLTELVRLDAAAGNTAGLLENLPRLLGMRKPSRAVLQEAHLKLSAPEHAGLRAAIDTALAKSPANPEPGA
jgi:hypothetical protein